MGVSEVSPSPSPAPESMHKEERSVADLSGERAVGYPKGEKPRLLESPTPTAPGGSPASSKS